MCTGATTRCVGGSNVNMIWVALGLSVLISKPVLAAPQCIDLQTQWQDHYVSDFKVDWSTASFTCPGGESALAMAFYDLQTMSFKPNKDGYRPDFYALVKGLVKQFHFDESCKYLALGYRSLGKITLCNPFFKDSREDRASTLVHETRHLQSDDPAHVTCAGGKYNGHTGACDDTFYDGTWQGSGFNADIFFYSWNLNGADKNELSRAVMQNEVNTMIPDRFNHITGEQTKKWRGN